MSGVDESATALVQRVDAAVRARGIRTPAWCEVLGIGRATWSRWRSGVYAPTHTAWPLLALIDDDPTLIGRLMELRARREEVGDE